MSIQYQLKRILLWLVLCDILLGAWQTSLAQGGKSYDVAPVQRPHNPAPQFPSPVTFTDVTQQARIAFRHDASSTTNKFLLETMGGGVALIDYDRDGRLDIFFTNGALLNEKMSVTSVPDKTDPRFWNRLYHQHSDGTFEDVTQKAGLKGAGYGFGAAAADYDGDGFTDLFVTSYGGTALYRNNGDGTFSDSTVRAGITISGWPASAGFFDYDRDGRLDLFVTRYVQWDFRQGALVCGDALHAKRSYCHPDNFKSTSSILFHQSPDGTFEDVSDKTGISESAGKALGVAFADLDNDGWTDIIVANDSTPQQVFRNGHDGKFEEVAVRSGLAFDDNGRPFSGMGVDVADYNNDGKPDVIATAFSGETYPLYRNQGGLLFDYVTGPSGVGVNTALGTGWGVRFCDVDNDGQRDLLFAQGHVSEIIERITDFLKYKQPLLLLRNAGSSFQNISNASGKVFSQGLAARGLASGDLDNDGDTDFVIAQTNGAPMLLRNNGTKNHWIGIDLRGKNGSPAGFGAKITVTEALGLKQVSEVTSGGSYLSSSDHRSIIGLGNSAIVREVQIQWPDGKIQVLQKPAVNVYHTVREK
jgi:hypothetical protein